MAVVVTKLTGALLFILLLTMVIMALIPKAVNLPSPGKSDPSEPPTLAVTTPETLPEAIAGRPYVLALAATGGKGPLRWSVSGELPEGLKLEPESGRLEGTPSKGTPKPAELVVSVTDGESRTSRPTSLVVYKSDQPLTTPAWWKPELPPVPWRAWLEQGFGFLVIWLVHVVGMNTVGGLERWSQANPDADPEASHRRFSLYRIMIRLGTVSATATLAIWLWLQRG